MHQTVFLGNIDTLTVQLTDVVLIVRTQAAVLSPELSAQIPDGHTDTLIEVQSHPLILDAVEILKKRIADCQEERGMTPNISRN